MVAVDATSSGVSTGARRKLEAFSASARRRRVTKDRAWADGTAVTWA